MMQSALKNCVGISASVFLTSALVLSNKFVLHNLVCGVVSAGALSCLHNLVSFFYILLYSRLKKQEWDSSEAPTTDYVLISCLSAISLISSNVLLSKGSILYHQLARIVCVPAGALVDFVIEGRKISRIEALLMFGIVGAACIAAVDDVTNAAGQSAIALVFVASYLSTASCVRRTARLFKLSSAKILFRTLPYSIVASMLWFLTMMALHDDVSNCLVMSEHFPMLASNCLLAISVQFLSTWTMKTVSVKLYAVVGQVKTATTVLLAGLILGEKVARRARLSFIFIVLFGSLLTVVENYPNGVLRRVISSPTLNVIVACCFVYYLSSSLSHPVTRGVHQQKSLLRYVMNEYDAGASNCSPILKTNFSVWVKENTDIQSTVSSAHGFPSNGPWYIHTGVCLDDGDGVKYFPYRVENYEASTASLGIVQAGVAFRPVPLNFSEYSNDHIVYTINERSLVVHCWQSWGFNPFHFLFAYGQLFRVVTSPLAPGSPFQHVFMHQCPEPHLTAFFETFWEILLSVGYEKGIFDECTKFHRTTRTELMCFKSLIDNSYVHGNYFPGIPGTQEEFSAWTKSFSSYAYSRWGLELSSLEHNKLTSAGAIQRPRIAIFQRTEGVNGLRSIANLEEVKNLAEKVGSSVQLITTSPSSLSAIDMILMFNSFDILVTAHGSQLANLLFTFSTPVVVIEVVPICINLVTKRWVEHRMSYIISTGHNVTDESLQGYVDICRVERNGDTCPTDWGPASCEKFLEIMNADLLVNIDKLRDDLNIAAGSWVGSLGSLRRRNML